MVKHPAFSTNVVWVPDPEEAYVLAKVVDIGTDIIKVELLNQKKPKIASFPYDSVFPAEYENSVDMSDTCALMFLNPGTVLYNLKRRYLKDVIYTYVANILIALNPYKTIKNLYSSETIKQYNGKSIGTLPPHIFAIADKSYREMRGMKISQSIIVSGESGAGKTETVKYLLRYLTASYGIESGTIEESINQSNPLLEAFGNAKTIRNNNSSRFGKFIELRFSKDFAIAGGYISHYLLERSRICFQSKTERNYHIFYQLCCGADDKLRNDLHLSSPDKFSFLKNGCSSYFLTSETNKLVSSDRKSAEHVKSGPLYDIQLDDLQGFKDCVTAMKQIGMSEETRKDVFSTVAAVLHMGNIDFEPDLSNKEGGCKVKEGVSFDALKAAASLIGLMPQELEHALVNRAIYTRRVPGRSGSLIFVPLKEEHARHARDALAKTLYARLFDYLVDSVNNAIPCDSFAFYIGILDIAGFEYFPINSFEQFCINYCNEKLQQFFNGRILRDEQQLYEREGLGIRHIDYVDNQDCIDLIEGRNIGIFDLLDEESKLPSPSFIHFTDEVFARNKNHARLELPRKSHLKLYREIRDDEGFMIRHFAGGVVYSTAQFIDKNNDAVHASLLLAVAACDKPFIQNLFATHTENTANQGKLSFISVGSKFRTQLSELLERLNATGTTFIRCIKPNQLMKPGIFDGAHILSQLQYAGMLSVLELMQQGFPSRAHFSVLYNNYKQYMPSTLAKLDPRFFCKGLFHCLDMNDSDFRFGLTRIFFRPGKFAEFDLLMRTDPEHLKALVIRVRKWVCKARWKKAQYFILSAIKIKNRMNYRRQTIIYLQSCIRTYLEYNRHHFRINGIMKLNKISDKIASFEKIQDTLRGQSKVDFQNRMKIIREKLNQLYTFITQNQSINKKDIYDQYEKGIKSLENEIEHSYQVALEKHKQEENERIKALQAELEAEKKRLEKEKLQREEESAKARLRLNMETRRKVEEARMAKLKPQNSQQNDKISENHKNFIEQQIRLDHHLASRLAADTGSEVDPIAIIGLDIPKKQPPSKYDLSSWKYAQLRDTINTSCDIELLEACREEFHRRLKAYHNWKAKNRARGAPVERRVPPEIAEAVANMKALVGDDVVLPGEQRYFRIQLDTGGTWFAHFDGRWVCRQMIAYHDGRPATLYVAGVDDMHMCELGLDETDLTVRKDVEILEDEFEREWKKNNGAEYLANNFSQISSKALQEKVKQHVNLMDF